MDTGWAPGKPDLQQQWTHASYIWVSNWHIHLITWFLPLWPLVLISHLPSPHEDMQQRQQLHAPHILEMYDKLKKIQGLESFESIPDSAACLKVSRSLKKKGFKTNESPQTQYSTPTYCICTHTVFQRATEEAKGRFLLVPLGHLLTPSLDLSEFGLWSDLCDAFHCDAFKKYCSLGGKRRRTEGWTWLEFKDAPSHTYRRNILNTGDTSQPAASLLYESQCAETTGRNIINPGLPFWPLCF